ncbi:hypothetical protein QCO44_02515 [Selenomonas sputigena]|uniref:Uncharacterized protein n=1 Tax=Selenomonas sputigena TaxID=69823 RepID=A0ABV3X3Z0_9FIRM
MKKENPAGEGDLAGFFLRQSDGLLCGAAGFGMRKREIKKEIGRYLKKGR